MSSFFSLFLLSILNTQHVYPYQQAEEKDTLKLLDQSPLAVQLLMQI